MRYKKKDAILQRKEKGMTVLFNPDTGEPFYIENTGEDIWNLLDVPVTPEKIRDTLSKRYDTDKDILRDIRDFLEECRKEGLVDVL